MGKNDEEQPPPAAVTSPSSKGCRWFCGFLWIRKLIGFKCVFILLLSIALFLSAVFSFHLFHRHLDLDLNSTFEGHDIVATFNVENPVFLLKDNMAQLVNDIFGEFSVPSANVVILSLKALPGSNITNVVFGIDPDPDAEDSKIPPTSLSLIRSTFADFVTNQSILHLTTSLFGEAFSFEVLKFPGGITIIPPQNVFLLQKVQILFSFTLNFSIHEIQVQFNELKRQLEGGLRLAPYEILYIKLWNEKGSTVTGPTIVESSVLLEVGTPSMQRLKQLAQTIAGSHSSNLGLNNTEFGKVKQVRLSSFLKHSINGGNGNRPMGPSPAPTPQPHNYHHPPTHKHGHHHHHSSLTPEISPAPATGKGAPEYGSPSPERSSASPERSHVAKPPGCQDRYKRKSTRKEGKKSHLTPLASPNISPVYSAASPQHEVDPPAPVSPIPASSPLPNVVYAHVQPPSKSVSNPEKSNTNPSLAPSPSPSSADHHTVRWEFALVLILALLRMLP